MKKILCVVWTVLLVCLCSCKGGEDCGNDNWYMGKEFSDGESYLSVVDDEECIYFYIDGILICGVSRDDVDKSDGVYIYKKDNVIVRYDGSVRVDDGTGTYPNPFVELEDPWKTFSIDYLMRYNINGMSLGDVYGYFDSCDVIKEENQNIYELLNYTGEEEFLYLTECFSDDGRYIEYVSVCGSYDYVLDAVNIAEYALNVLRCNCSEYSNEFEKVYRGEELCFIDDTLVIEYLDNSVVVKIYNTGKVGRG